MPRDGKYIYAIISSDYECNYGPIGIGGRGDFVTTIGVDGLSMIVSDYSLNHCMVNPENILAHQNVIEAVMGDFNSIIPVRFGTLASTVDEIINLLIRKKYHFTELLKQFEDKVEYNLKGLWRNIGIIYKEIDQENFILSNYRNEIEMLDEIEKNKDRIAAAGCLIEKALHKKKQDESAEIISAFRKTIFEYKNNKTIGDSMFMNTAFLMNKNRCLEFANILSDLGEKYKDRSDYFYTGPLPVFNFIDFRIFPEKWEL